MAAAVERWATGGRPNVVVVRSARRLRGEVRLPGDKSISHRALMLALLADGESRLEGCGDGDDIRSTAAVARALGATVARLDGDDGTVTYIVASPGVGGLRQPARVLDCGNSGTSLRLFAGILAGVPLTAVLDGDASLRRRPVARIIEPLRSMGAELSARQDDSVPPLTVVGHSPLRAIEWTTAVPSAQVKSAILLAGLRATGSTRVRESIATRDHTERMLRARGIDVRTARDGKLGVVVSVEGGTAVQAFDERVPGDLSSAAFWVVAAAIHADAELTIHGAGVNPTRRAVLDLLAAMGARIDERPNASPAAAEIAGDTAAIGEPSADLVVRTSQLQAIDIGPSDVAAAIDELPILCLAATQARGRTTIKGAGELRHKEADRVAGIATGLAAMGAHVEVDGDDMAIEGPTPLTGAAVDSLADHRLAMTFAVGGLIARGETVISDAESAAVSYPGFFGDLERIGS